MPKLLFSVLLFLFFGGTLAAQSLNFSQVLNFSRDCSIDDHIIDTVPAGKTWKLETFRTEDVFIEVKANNGPFIRLNAYWDTYPASAPGNTSTSNLARAVWLSEGTIVRANCASPSIDDYYFLSILEFSILP